MGRIIRADTIRLDDFINLDYSLQPDTLSYGRRGWVDSITHASRNTIEVTLVRADTWPLTPEEQAAADRATYSLALSNHFFGPDMVWRK